MRISSLKYLYFKIYITFLSLIKKNARKRKIVGVVGSCRVYFRKCRFSCRWRTSKNQGNGSGFPNTYQKEGGIGTMLSAETNGWMNWLLGLIIKLGLTVSWSCFIVCMTSIIHTGLLFRNHSLAGTHSPYLGHKSG